MDKSLNTTCIQAFFMNEQNKNNESIMLYSSVNYVPINNIPLNDRGLAFGDGVFSTAKIINGSVAHLDKHMQRLQTACQRIAIIKINWQQLEGELIKLAKGYQRACLKVIISAGESQRGYSRVGGQGANIIITVSNFPSHYDAWEQKGISVGISSIKLGLNPLLAGLKHLNRLEQVLIRAELDALPFDDVLVTDINGDIIETNCANVFWLADGQWHTPKLDNAGVNGIIRDRILVQNPAIIESNYPMESLDNVEAMFISNSLHGIIGVHTFDGRKLNLEPVNLLKQQFSQPIQDTTHAF